MEPRGECFVRFQWYRCRGVWLDIPFWEPIASLKKAYLGSLATAGDNTTCQFTIDGGNAVNFVNPTALPSAQYHTQFYSASFDDGAHTLLMNITRANATMIPPKADLFLDYIIYTPSIGSSACGNDGQLFFFDDTDPAFRYQGPWSTGDGTEEDMQSTLHGALSLQSSVSLQFTGAII